MLLKLASALGFAALAHAQSASAWYDDLTGVTFRRYYNADVDTTWGYIFPPATGALDEFVGIFQAPASAGWMGNSLGGSMRNAPLLLGWVDSGNPKLSVRWATDYAPPALYAGPRLTILGSSGTDGTVQRIVYRCQNCTTWTGGSGGVPLNGTTVLGYAFSTNKPINPSVATSPVNQHTTASQFGLDLRTGRSSSYTFFLQELTNAPPLSGSAGPVEPPIISTTTSSTSTSTTSTSSTTSSIPTTTPPTSTPTSTSTRPPITTTSSGIPLPNPTTGTGQWWDALTNVTFRRYYNADLDTTWGYLFPAANVSTTDEFIGIFQAPAAAGYIGNSLGQGMKNNPLILGWVDGGQPRVSARWATDYAPPVPLAGPRLTILGSSGTDGTVQRIVYRCQGCTTWNGGSIPLTGSTVLGYAFGSQPPVEPSDPYSGVFQHSAQGLFGFSLLTGRSASYTWYLEQLTNAPPLSGSTGPIPQPTIGTTILPPTSTVPTITTTPTSGGPTITGPITTTSQGPVPTIGATSWYDALTNVTFRRYYNSDTQASFGYIFPASNVSSTDEFIGILQAPVSAGYIGNSLGPSMKNNLLLAAWVDAGQPRISARWATDYAPPVPLSGPRLTILGSSGTDGTIQRIVYRCQGCTSWPGGGGVPLAGTHVMGFVLGSQPPIDPSDPYSGVNKHSLAGLHSFSMLTGRSASYTFYLDALINAAPLSGTTGPIPQPSGGTTIAPTPTTTPTTAPTTTPTLTPPPSSTTTATGITTTSQGPVPTIAATSWYDAVTNVTFRRYYNSDTQASFGYIFPASNVSSTDEFIGILQAPVSAGYIGNSLGPSMKNNLLLSAWVDAGQPRISARWATDYAPPTPLAGPRLTILGSSGTDGTIQRIVYRCQGCTSWSGGGGVPLTGTHVMGFVLGSQPPIDPSNPYSGLNKHTVAGLHAFSMLSGRSASYTFYLDELTKAAPLSGTTGPIPQPSGGSTIAPTTTTATTTTPVTIPASTPTVPTSSSTTPTSTSTLTTAPTTAPSTTIVPPTSTSQVPIPSISAGSWYDGVTNVTFRRYYNTNLQATYGYIFPPTNGSTDEFIGILQAPVAAGYLGNSLGPSMKNNPLIVGWVDGTTARVSARWATDYAPPAAYTGPRLTILGSSGSDGTLQRIVYRCQNCTTWNGGSIPLSGTHVMGFVYGSNPPVDPSDPNSGVYKHTIAGLHAYSMLTGRSASYSFYLDELTKAPPFAGTKKNKRRAAWFWW